jgi:hypothetical protein
MLSNDQIIEMALNAGLIDVGEQYIPEVFAFARLIEAECKRQQNFQNSCGEVIRKNAERYMFIRCMSVHDYKELVMENLHGGASFDELVDEHIAAAIRESGK